MLDFFSSECGHLHGKKNFCHYLKSVLICFSEAVTIANSLFLFTLLPGRKCMHKESADVLPMFELSTNQHS